MSNLLGLPNEILQEIPVGVETKHLHCLALTNRFLYRLLQTRLYEPQSNDALKNVIHKENFAVLRTMVDYGLNVNVGTLGTLTQRLHSWHILQQRQTRGDWPW
jgi:hypothetical protein